jgi:hypothetical protein
LPLPKRFKGAMLPIPGNHPRAHRVLHNEVCHLSTETNGIVF